MARKFLLMLAVLLFVSSTVFAAGNAKLFVNGQEINADVKMENGTSYVPLRVVSEALGADVGWDESTNTISIKNNSNSGIPRNNVVELQQLSELVGDIAYVGELDNLVFLLVTIINNSQKQSDYQQALALAERINEESIKSSQKRFANYPFAQGDINSLKQMGYYLILSKESLLKLNTQDANNYAQSSKAIADIMYNKYYSLMGSKFQQALN